MILGCSYSALYYHPDPRWSYTWQLKDALGAENLLNLSFGGNSPAGCTRILEHYLSNPIKGYPDLIYCQVPGGHREEYYLSNEEWKGLAETTYIHTSKLLQVPNWMRSKSAFDDYENFKRPRDVNFTSDEELINDVPWVNCPLLAGTCDNKRGFQQNNVELAKKDGFGGEIYVTSDYVNNIQPSWDESRLGNEVFGKQKIKEFHRLWSVHKMPMLSMLNTTRKEIALMQTIADRYNIPIIFNSSKNEMHDGKLESFDDEKTHYDSLINWDRYIKYQSISNGSPTCVDEYWDGHPGRQSHENYANAIIPKVLDVL